MKNILLLIIAVMFSNITLAENNAVNLCVDMIKQKQEQGDTPKISDKQANTYCQCIIPKLEQLRTGAAPSQTELNNLYQQCMTKAGIQ